MPVSPEFPRMTVELDMNRSGKHKRYTVTAFGRYVTHRLVEFDFVHQGRWEHRVTVDLDDELVVQTRWDPTPDDIAKARNIADPTLSEFLRSTKSNELKVRAYGKYDFGPTRRYIHLSYEKPSSQSLGHETKFSIVDIDNQRLK